MACLVLSAFLSCPVPSPHSPSTSCFSKFSQSQEQQPVVKALCAGTTYCRQAGASEVKCNRYGRQAKAWRDWLLTMPRRHATAPRAHYVMKRIERTVKTALRRSQEWQRPGRHTTQPAATPAQKTVRVHTLQYTLETQRRREEKREEIESSVKAGRREGGGDRGRGGEV